MWCVLNVNVLCLSNKNLFGCKIIWKRKKNCMCCSNVLNMCNVPPKFYQVCRLCLSCPSLSTSTTNTQENTDDETQTDSAAADVDKKVINKSIFDKDDTDYKWQKRNIPFKIMTCLSILVGDSYLPIFF